jgi:protein-disulfide isomerase
MAKQPVKRKNEPVTAAAAKWSAPPRWSSALLAGAAAAGFALGGLATWVHHEVTTSRGSFTSFCNVNDTVNCDRVITSEYSTLLRVPVGVWAMVFYAVLLGCALLAIYGKHKERDRARADAFALTVAGACFSAYLAFISYALLKTVCLICTSLYVVSAVALGAAYMQARPLSQAASRLVDRWNAVRNRPGLSAAVITGLAAVFVLSSWLGAQPRLTKEQVLKSNPQFFDWYTSQPIVSDPVEGGHSRGAENAPIQLVEFSDYECPHCAQAYVTLKDLLPRYKDQVRFISHNFPLSNDCNESMTSKGHEHACSAAYAAECAADGGKFEPFTNLLFANQGSLDLKSLSGYAKQVGLDVDAFENCMRSSAPSERVSADVKAGIKAGVVSTPTFFINGRRIQGNMPYENWLMAFAVELDKS